jgi:formylmethanofuran dehydrogenase subunit E
MADVRNSLVRGIRPAKGVGADSWQEFLNRLISFHGYPAPGVIVGGIMVDTAKKQIPEGVLFDAICETSSCLPDAVQLLTPCTVGNGWLRVINLGRYALSLYDKYKGNGVRIYLDPKKLEGWDEIKAWFLKLKTKDEQDTERLQEQILKAGRDIYTLHKVQVKPEYLKKRSKGPIAICSVCGEAYPARDGEICLGCQGESPYEAFFPSGDGNR